MPGVAPAPRAAHGATPAHGWWGRADPTSPTNTGCTAGLASASLRPSSSSLARANRERVPAKRGPGGHRAAIWAMIHEHPSSCSLTGRAGGHQAAQGVPLVPCRPQGRAPGVTPHQSHCAAAPRRTDTVWVQRAPAWGCSVGPCHHSELFYGGEPTSTGPPRPPCAACRALPVPSQRGRGAGQRGSRLLPSAAFCRMRPPGMGTPTLRGVGAAPCPRFMAPQSAARLRDGGAASLGHVTVGGTWHCGGACGDRSPFPAAVPVPLRCTAAGWGHGHARSPRGTAPARPYRLEFGPVVLGHVAGLVDLRFVPGLDANGLS